MAYLYGLSTQKVLQCIKHACNCWDFIQHNTIEQTQHNTIAPFISVKLKALFLFLTSSQLDTLVQSKIPGLQRI